MIEKISAENVRKQYNSRFALSCSIEVTRQPIYAIVGPNGSGKSTLLRILGLLKRPDSGMVLYHDTESGVSDPCDDIRTRRKVVLVPTRPAVFNESVYDNVAYGLKLRKIARHAMRDRVMTILKEMKLADKSGRMARELSSGEAQRLTLGRAFVLDPDVLLLDEPTASLDVVNTRLVEEMIRQQKVRGKMVVMVTHSLHQARQMSDVIIFIYDGKIVEVSDTREFFAGPSSELSRQYISGLIY